MTKHMKSMFEKKVVSSFQDASLTNLEGGKYAGGSRPSCCTSTEELVLMC